MTSFIFYLLSFTWGLPMTLAGCFASLFMLLAGKKPERVGYCFCFRVGRGWGGLSLGIFIFASEDLNKRILWHEHGHGLQNCVFGPFTVFFVSLPSAVRYWYRRLKKNKSNLKPYDGIWFEGQATRIGQRQRILLGLKKKS